MQALFAMARAVPEELVPVLDVDPRQPAQPLGHAARSEQVPATSGQLAERLEIRC